jgi:hypothetical protein
MVLGLCVWPVAAKNWLLPEDQWRPYGVVRNELLAKGWKPFKPPRNIELEPFCGLDGRLCRGFPETLWCQQAGKPSCTMGFYKASPRQYLVVRGTLAEEPSESMMVDEIVSPGKKFIDQWFLGRGP